MTWYFEPLQMEQRLLPNVSATAGPTLTKKGDGIRPREEVSALSRLIHHTKPERFLFGTCSKFAPPAKAT